MREGDHRSGARLGVGEGLAPHEPEWTSETPALSAQSSPGGQSTPDFSLPSHPSLPPQHKGAPV